MTFSLNRAHDLSSRINSFLHSKGHESYVNVSPSSVPDRFVLNLVLHPDESFIDSVSPSFLSRVPWDGGQKDNPSPYVKETPRTPSRAKDTYEHWYPGVARRRHEPSLSYNDVNPAYPGMRRVPDIQDLVRRVAMRKDIKLRLIKAQKSINTLSRLKILARRVYSPHKESVFLIGELSSVLKSQGYTNRHKCMRCVNTLKSALESEGYSF